MNLTEQDLEKLSYFISLLNDVEPNDMQYCYSVIHECKKLLKRNK